MTQSNERALQLLNSGDIPAASAFIEQSLAATPEDAQLLYVWGRLLFMTERYAEASNVLAKASKADPSNVEIAYASAIASRSLGTMKGMAAGRDALLALVDNNSADARIMRAAAESCSCVGPEERAVDLWQRVVQGTAEADVHFALSEALAVVGRRTEALAALHEAAALDPERYSKALAEARIDENGRATSHGPLIHSRYSFADDIASDLKGAINRLLLTDFNAPRFVTKNTAFFTIGSCFAWTITKTLTGMGYGATCIPLSENLNTTFGIRHFVDWLDDSISDSEVADRIADMVPAGYSKRSIVEKFLEADVFLLTVGTAAGFFDRETGAFIVPRPTALNLRTLAEKYEFRTTTVAENVENVSHVLEFIRKSNPNAKMIVMMSPVPMYTSFEFASALIADCVSKSVMRVVAHELVQRYGSSGRLLYFPSFEVFRWLGSHMKLPLYGTDDGAPVHVSEDAIETVVQSLIERLADHSEGSGHTAAVAEAPPAIALTPLFSPGMIDRKRPAYFYGSGQMGQGLLAAMGEPASWTFKGFIDSRSAGTCRGYPVFDLAQFRSSYRAGEQVVITSGSVGEIARVLAQLGVPEAKDANPWWRARAFPAIS